MTFRYEDLDATTRACMTAEFERDRDAGKLYASPRLTTSGLAAFGDLLAEALTQHDPAWLAHQLGREGVFKRKEKRRIASGTIEAEVPRTAPATLAEGQFNHFYIRGLCQRALDEGATELEVYRAKAVSSPRSRSEELIGTRLDAASLLTELREAASEQWFGADLSFPPGPNTGLSVRLLRDRDGSSSD